MKRLANVAVVALVALTLAAALIPASDLSWMRSDWRWIGRTMNWIEAIPGPFDMTHVLLFALLGVAAMAVRRTSRLRDAVSAGLWLAALSALTELAQMLAPGRRESWPDFRDDVVGAFAGIALGWLLRALGAAMFGRHAPAPDMRPERRAWISASLRGDAAASVPDDAATRDALLAEIDEHGVAPLLHEAWSVADAGAAVPKGLREAVSERARASSMRHLALLAESRRITATLQAAGIDFLWLKGAALAVWLYRSPHLRPFADLDVLFASHADALRAADALATLGYHLPIRHIAGDLYVYELLAFNARIGLEFDMHWRLANTALFADRLHWDELRATAIDLPALGAGARGLAPVHALLHACLHRVSNRLTGRENRLHWLYDMHLLAQRLTPDEWSRFVTLAIERRLAEPCLDALRACAADLGTPLPADRITALADAATREPLRSARLGDWFHLQRATLCELPTWRLRMRWLRQMLIGDEAHLRERYGGGGAGVVRLVGRRVGDGVRRWFGYVRV